MKKIESKIKLQVAAGQATAAPPVGPALGQHGLNIPEFIKQFNARTKKEEPGITIPVVITVFVDKSFTFVTKTPPASVLLKREAKIAKGSGDPLKEQVGRVTKDQVRKIAELKEKDLNANDIEAAMKIIEGTARSMGIQII